MHERSARFHQEVVVGTVAQFLAADHSIRLGSLAAIVLSHLADYWAIETGQTAYNVRQEFVDQCPPFQLVWDVADATKHCVLTQRAGTRTIDQAAQIHGDMGAIGSMGINEAPINGAAPVEVVMNDGTFAYLAPAVSIVASHWRSKFESAQP